MGNNEYCRRCGTAIYGFSKKVSESNGLTYCIRCAELMDKRYLIENTCSVCAKKLDRHEAKFVMPSSIYNASRLPLSKRLICVDCYRRFAVRNRSRPLSSIYRIRMNFRNRLLSRSLQPRVVQARN